MNTETVDDGEGNIKFNAYLKNAQVDWRGNGFFLSAGLVNLRQFSEQENFWGHRYVFKSFQEQYGITFCEDIGILAGFEYSPIRQIRISPNFQSMKAKNGKSENYILLSVECRL